MLTVKTLKSLRTDENFNLFGLNKEKLQLNLLQLQKMNALDLATTSICSRFDQKGFKIFSNVQQLLFKACIAGQSFNEELDVYVISLMMIFLKSCQHNY